MALKKWFLSSLLFCAFFVSRADALVSFLVIETGLPAAAGAMEYSAIWEDSLMEAFFEAGHIVSNAPMLRLAEAGAAEALAQAAQRAAQVGAQFLVAVILHYGHAAASLAPQSASLQIVRAATRKTVHERQIPAEQMRNRDFVRAAVNGIIPYLSI